MWARDQVSGAAALLDEELECWRTRELGAHHFVILDASYEKVRHCGQVRSIAVLCAIGVNMEGRRSVIGVSTSLSEAEVHWREFLQSLLARGLIGVRLITSDDHSGLKAALRSVMPGTPWQRCQFHQQRNAGSKVPRKDMRAKVASDIRAIFNAPNLHEAKRLLGQAVERYSKSAPDLSVWLENDIPEGLAVFAFGDRQRRRLRTSNVCERLHMELERRTRVATLFPNEASLLRLVSAILVEVSDEWETGKTYLNVETT